MYDGIKKATPKRPSLSNKESFGNPNHTFEVLTLMQRNSVYVYFFDIIFPIYDTDETLENQMKTVESAFVAALRL